MKRRLIIAATMLVLYAVLMAVAWTIGTEKAAESTNAQLDYAVIDLHDTVAGAIDTMLGHVARTAVRHIGSAKPMSLERMAAGAKELDIDEVNTVDRSGRIIASNDPHCLNGQFDVRHDAALWLCREYHGHRFRPDRALLSKQLRPLRRAGGLASGHR